MCDKYKSCGKASSHGRSSGFTIDSLPVMLRKVYTMAVQVVRVNGIKQNI